MNTRSLLILFILSFRISLLGQSEIVVDRGPYLQQSTTTGITIQWRTEDPTESIVWYGSAPGDLNESIENLELKEDHTIELTGLNTGTTYYYAIGNSNGILAGNDAAHFFKTNPAIGSTTPFRAWILGDAGTGTPEQRSTRDGFLDFLGAQSVDLMMMLGDNAYDDGKQSEYQDAFFEDMYEDILNKVVVWPALGNHDSYSTNSETRTGPYYDIFTLPKNGESGGTPSGTEAYYSYDYANVHFVVLNSEDSDRSPTGEMAQWIEADLSATDQDWIVAYFHHPIYSGAHNNESDDADHEKDMRENILPILEAHDIDLVLFGHTHNYQRSFLVKGHYGPSNTFDPLTMAVDEGSGRLSDETPYTKLNDDGGAIFVCMGNAAKLEDEPEEELQHPTTFIGRDLRGSASMEVNSDQLDFKFVLEDGTVEDHFTILKAINPLTITMTNPTNNRHYVNLQNINIRATASDPEGGVVSVEFFVNGNSVGIDYNAPYGVNWHPLYAGSYTLKATATDTDGFKKSVTHYITVGETTTTCIQIDQSTDDAEQRENGSINLTSGDIELIEDDNDNQIVGLRFNNLNLQKGAAISNAFLNFKIKDDTNENPCLITVYGQTGNNTTTFTSTSYDISNRPKTNNSITWSPPNWNTPDEIRSSSDIRAVIQELVMQDSYDPSQSIVLILEGIGARNAISFDQGDGSGAPELCVTFDANNCLDTDFDGSCDIDDLCLMGPEPGQSCNDGNASTFDDLVNNNCVCKGTFYDCINLNAQFGSPCDDGDTSTFDDKVTLDCECEGTPYDCPNLNVQFGSPCNDNKPETFDDLITNDCECEGTPYDCPDLQLQYGTPCDDNNPFTCEDVINTNCECAGTPTSETVTLTSQIDQDSDDAEQRDNGSVSTTSSDLEIIRDASDQIIGLRFDNPGIEPGFVISSAYVQFTVDENKNTNPCELSIYGERNIAANTFTNTSNNISTRTRTSATVQWSPPNWSSVGDNGSAQRTTNIAPILQEIVNLNGYTPQTPFVIMIEGEGRRVAVSHDKNSNDAPLLSVTYEINLGDADGDGVCDVEDQCSGPEPGSPCNDNNMSTYNDLVNNNCLCIGTPFDCPELAVQFGSPCDDGDATTFNDYVDENCNCVGALFECVLLSANIGDACNDGDPLTTNDQVDGNCNCTGIPPVEAERCERIRFGVDDAEEKANGNMSVGSSDLELVEDRGDQQLVGLRFRQFGLAHGTIIGDSYLQFTVDKDNNINPCVLTIHGELNPDASAFATGNDNISDRTKTNASVSWTPAEWEENGDKGLAQRSPNLREIIQEIVDQPGFEAGSAIVFIISGEGLRQAVSFEESEDDAVELCVGFYESATQGMVVSNNGEAIIDVQMAIEKEEEKKGATQKSKQSNNKISSYLKVYPNPAVASISATFDVMTTGEVQLHILDTNGQLLLEEQHNVTSGENQIAIAVADLPNGVYFLTLQTNTTHRVAKFSILK